MRPATEALLFSISNKSEIWHPHPTPNALLWLLQRREQVLEKSRTTHLDIAHRFTGLNYSQIAERVRTSEQRIIDSQFCTNPLRLPEMLIDLLVCTGAAIPTNAEFQAITVVLGVQNQVRIRPIPRDRRLTASRLLCTRRRNPYKDHTSM